MRFAIAVSIALAAALSARTAAAAEIDDVNAAVFATYSTPCDLFLEDGGPAYPPDVYSFTYRSAWMAEGDPPGELRLYRYRCRIGAYNVGHVFFSVTEDGIVPLHFAVPVYRVIYEGGADKPASDTTPVREIVIQGFGTVFRLSNTEVDAATGTIRSIAWGRGIGDVSSTGEYRLIGGEYGLVTYDVDPTYDGKVNPLRIWDKNGARGND